MERSSPARIQSLDYLRGLMALAVMVYHYWSWGVGAPDSGSVLGRLGIYAVSAFFVLSGLSLGIVYQDRMAGARDAAAFLVKRVCRIAPLFWLSVVCALLLGKTAMASTIWLNLTLTFGFFRPTAYLSTGAWSIGVEVVFYAMLPILLLVGRGRPWVMWWALLVSVAAALEIAFLWMDGSPLRGQWPRYITFENQAFLFFAGVLMARWRPSRHRWNWLLLSACLVVFCLWPAEGDRSALVHGWTRVALSLCCIGAVLSVYQLAPEIHGAAARALAFFGEGCYSIYLLHPLVAMPLAAVAGVWGYVLAVPVTMAVAWASFRWIEQPGMSLGRRFADMLRGAEITSRAAC